MPNTDGLQTFRQWLIYIDLASVVGVDYVMPAACVGSYARRLVVTTMWPLAVLSLAGSACWMGQLVRQWRTGLTPRAGAATLTY